jgi:hypothetical protein
MSTTDTTESKDEVNDWLESRHTKYVTWVEPWAACGPEGNELNAHVILRATIHDCINMRRLVAKAEGHSPMGGDRDRLLDFMAIHWAEVAHDDFARTSPQHQAVESLFKAYDKWNDREDGGEDDLHQAVRHAKATLGKSQANPNHNTL